MTLDDFTPTSGRRFHADAAGVDEAERQLQIRFPIGYREFIARFGEGLLGGLIRIYSPKRILSGSNNVSEWRARINEYWLWDESEDLLPKEKAIECTIVGDSVQGDELISHPSQPDRIYVLPRYEYKAIVAGNGLLESIDWALTSGELCERVDDRSFEPFDSGAESDG